MTVRFLDRVLPSAAALLLVSCSGMENFDSVETVRSLRAVSSPDMGTTVLVRHHSSASDHGGGLFWYDSEYKCEDESGCDDNGTIIRPNVKGSKQRGRWVRVTENPGVISVQWFGAQGNGSNNDLCAINGALAATPIGGTLVFPRPERGYRIAPVSACSFVASEAASGSLIQITRSVHLRGEGGVVKQTDARHGTGNSEIRIVSAAWNDDAHHGAGGFVPLHDAPVIAVLNPKDAAARAFLEQPYCEASQAEIVGYPKIKLEGAGSPPVLPEDQLPEDSVLEGHSFSISNLKLEHGSHGIWSRATVAGDQSNWQDLRISNPRCAGIRLSDGADYRGLSIRRLSIESPGVAPNVDKTCTVHESASEKAGSELMPVAQFGISADGMALKDARLEELRIRNTRVAGIYLQNLDSGGHRLAIERLVLADNHGAGFLSEGQLDVHIRDARFENNGRELGHPDMVLSNGAGAVPVGMVEDPGRSVGPAASAPSFPPHVLKHVNSETTRVKVERSEFGNPSSCQGSSGNAVVQPNAKRVRILSTHNAARLQLDDVAFLGESDVIDVAHSTDTRVSGTLFQGVEQVTVFAGSEAQCAHQGQRRQSSDEYEYRWPNTGSEADLDRSIIQCEVPYRGAEATDEEG